MDPDANLIEQRRIAARILDGKSTDIKHDAMRLAELIEALDRWLANDGFLPSRWTKKGAR